jgi:spore coat polysaccharide biosynthesis predicted glycosyltransferase SpsG
MRILFVCKASTEVGLGHLMRSKALAEEAARKHEVSLFAIGSRQVRALLRQNSFPWEIVDGEAEIPHIVKGDWDAVIFDMISLGEDPYRYLKDCSALSVSLSPIFDHMDTVDLLFNRTKHVPDAYKSLSTKQYLGLDYAIIQPSCIRIDTERFRTNLVRDHFPVAVSMGGGDAANKTLLFLRSLGKCNVPATFWVLVGEGYSHSYDALVNTIERDKNHEIILAKTNMSMWHILSNCVLAVLPGGITTYEAAYAGLPTINMCRDNHQFFLIQELVEAGVGMYAGLMETDDLRRLNSLIENLYEHRGELLRMHERSRGIIDGRGKDRIISTIEEHFAARSCHTNQTGVRRATCSHTTS